MPFFYVYSPDDFVGGLPSESTNATSGWNSLTLKPGATPTLIEMVDDDGNFDEVDASQVLAGDINLDGTTYAAGSPVHSAYDLINSSSGLKVTSLHFTGDGNNGGPVHGLIATEELLPGTTYTFDINRTSHLKSNPSSEYVACFTPGARIETQNGTLPIEALQPGDMIATRDRGYQPLRLLLRTYVSRERLVTHPNLRPIRITAGALGLGLPTRDLLVSPQHRFLTISPIAKRMFSREDILVSAKRLTALPGIFVQDTDDPVTYLHFVMDQHEVIFADGTPTESFYCGPMAVHLLDEAARVEIDALFPGLTTYSEIPKPARTIPCGSQQKKLIERHRKNRKALLNYAC